MNLCHFKLSNLDIGHISNKYEKNMQKIKTQYAKYAKNMQNICKNYFKNMQKYAVYVGTIFCIHEICTGDFAQADFPFMQISSLCTI